MRQHFFPEFNFDTKELCNNLRSPNERSQPHTGVSELRSRSHPASKWNVISWCVVSIYQWFRWNKPFTKRLFTSLSVCMHKGFDLRWNVVATQKGHRHCYLQANPAASPVVTAHHPQSPICVSDGVRLSLSVCLSVCLSTSSFSCVPLFDSHVHSRTFTPNNHCHHHHCCYWSYFIFFLFFWKRRETALLSGRCWWGGWSREGGREGG